MYLFELPLSFAAGLIAVVVTGFILKICRQLESSHDRIASGLFCRLVSAIKRIREFKKHRTLIEIIMLMIKAVVIAVTIAIHIRYYGLQIYMVEHNSMTPALKPGDFVVVEKLSTGLRLPPGFSNPDDTNYISRLFYSAAGSKNRHDMVVFKVPGHKQTDFFIKRIIAVGNENVSFSDSGQVLVNNKELNENYLYADLKTVYLPREKQTDPAPTTIKGYGKEAIRAFLDGITTTVTVPENMIFVLGDNRRASRDSRIFGFIPVEYIIGRVVFHLPGKKTL